MDDVLNKAFRTLASPTTPEGEWKNARDTIVRIIGNGTATVYLNVGDEIARLRAEKAELKLENINLKERCERWYHQLGRLRNAFKHRTQAETPADESEIHNHAKQWMIDQLLDAGDRGVSKNALMKGRSKKARASITKRWSEVQNENHGFLIKPTMGDQVMVHYNFKDQYPHEFLAHQRRNEAKITSATTKMRRAKEVA